MQNDGWKKIFAALVAGAVLVTGGAVLPLYWRQEEAWKCQETGPQLILDAGHGGEDGGAVSLTGVPESSINLAVTLKVDRLLGFFGVSSILLRETDVSLHDPQADTIRKKKVSDLHNRVAAVEAVENAVVISIHQNAFSNPSYHGAQTFYRSTAESKALAEALQQALQAADPDNKRTPAVIPGSVYLMKHITCPAVLVECGFLSNPREEELLRSEVYQTQLAACIAGAWLKSGEIWGGGGGKTVV